MYILIMLFPSSTRKMANDQGQRARTYGFKGTPGKDAVRVVCVRLS